MSVLFTSDTHFWDRSILNFCLSTRPGGIEPEEGPLILWSWEQV